MHVVDQVQGVEAEVQDLKVMKPKGTLSWKCRKEQTSTRDGLIMVGQQLNSCKLMMESYW
jgi:hypothetical protein